MEYAYIFIIIFGLCLVACGFFMVFYNKNQIHSATKEREEVGYAVIGVGAALILFFLIQHIRQYI